MATYQFRRLADDQIVEARFPMAEAPGLGQIVEIDGAPCERIVSDSIGLATPGAEERGRGVFRGDADSVRNLVDGVPASRSLPRRDTSKGQVCSRYGKRVVEYSDGTHSTLGGQPIIASGRDRREAEARTGFKKAD